MKKVLAIWIFAVVICGAGYWTYYHFATAPNSSMLENSNGEMEWLRKEFHLTDTQFERIQKLHREYAPKCDLMCDRIGKANARFDQITNASKSYTPEVEAAMKECLAVQGDCRQALLAHIYAVSAEMSPADGARYLGMMKARILEPSLGHQSVISDSSK